jgi:hypothetical protein
MKIEPTYTTLKQSKWLKEKGFDEECSHSYKEVEPVILYQHYDKKYNNSFKKEWQNTVRKNSHMDNAVMNRYSAPEQWQVVEWLRVNHGIWVDVTLSSDSKFLNLIRDIKNPNTHLGIARVNDISFFNSPQESYSAAFDYILTNNLI